MPDDSRPTPSERELSAETDSDTSKLYSNQSSVRSLPVLSDRRLTVRRVDRPSAVVAAKSEVVDVSPPASPTRRAKKGPDPITQSLMLLATMGLMLVAARYAVPRIVEEIRYAWHRGELRAEYETGTDGLKNVSLDALSEAYQMVTAAVGPSVVHIDVQRRSSVDEANVARMLSGGNLPASDQGSGVVVDAEGYVLTNHHVIAEGQDITVTLSDGRRVSAIVVGTDALTDLAVLKIDVDRLMPIAWGDSDRCKVGSPVWAVGSPFGLDRTVTFGILSGKHRMVRASTQYQDFMQSDVAVNPGNSGGPLVDARGTLVGINTAIVGDTYQGVSFSIPSNVAKQVYQRLRLTGRVDRGWLGVALREVNDDDTLVGDNPRVRGTIVSGLTGPTSPAAVAGLQSGDLILQMNGNSVRDMGHLMRMIGDSLSGSTVALDVLRNTQQVQIDVKLGTRPTAMNLQ
ncbi:MAG: S1C family serine protease [Rubripirellula sp.]